MKKLLGVCLVLAACAGPPPIHFWSLTTPAAAPAGHCASNVQIGPIIVPDAYDRPDIVVTQGEHEITWSSDNQWEAPLPKILAGRLAASLRHELGSSQVYTWPSVLSEMPDYSVQLQIQQIRATLGGSVTLDAAWAVKTAKNGIRTNAASFVHGTGQTSFAGVVDAFGGDMDDLAHAVAQDIRAVGGCNQVVRD